MKRYEVIERRVWRNRDGRTASIYGAVPYATTAEAEGWSMESSGFTVRDNHTNTVGFGRPPFATRPEAEAFAAKLEAR